MVNKLKNGFFDFQGNEQSQRSSSPEEKTTTISDLQLWQEFQSGSESAFASIYELHAALLYETSVR